MRYESDYTGFWELKDLDMKAGLKAEYESC